MRTLGLVYAMATGLLLVVMGSWGVVAQAEPLEKEPLALPSPHSSASLPLNSSIHRLKSGDRIRLTVTGFPDLSGEQIIMADGMLQLPLAGAIAIAGRTPTEAVSAITEALRPYIRRPQVGLAVVSIRPSRISVTGEVLRPGPRFVVAMEPDRNASTPANTGGESFQTVSYALLLAGGITPNADIRNVVIRRAELRPMGDRSEFPSQPEIAEIKVDLWQAIQRGDLASDPQILDGDEIIVPTAQVSSAEQQQFLASTVAPAKITVQVAGQVQRPGSVNIVPTSGVTAAIAAAGGLTDKANQKSIALLRMTAGGRLERQTFAFGQDSGPLKDGDVIVASKSFLSSALDTMGSVFNPLAPLFFLLR